MPIKPKNRIVIWNQHKKNL